MLLPQSENCTFVYFNTLIFINYTKLPYKNVQCDNGVIYYCEKNNK